MRRPVDWAPLAFCDPVPGDPDAIVAVTRRHGNLAAELESQARTLRQLGSAEAQTTIDGLQSGLSGVSPQTPLTPDQIAAQHRQQETLDWARSDLERAKNRLRAAQGSRDAAGRAAQHRDGWDSFAAWFSENWNAFTSRVHEHAEILRTVAEWCSNIATVLSLVAIVISNRDQGRSGVNSGDAEEPVSAYI
jgi:hypothetical protein